MTIVHLHLLLNHVPVIGTLFVVALLATALMRRDGTIARVALWTSAVLGIVAMVVYFTGEPAEEAVEHLPGVSEAIIEQHEEVALVATTMIAAFSVLSVGALIAFRRRILPRWIVVSSLVGMLGVAGVMGWTANLGGQIRHSEIRAGGAGMQPERGDAGRETEDDH